MAALQGRIPARHPKLDGSAPRAGAFLSRRPASGKVLATPSQITSVSRRSLRIWIILDHPMKHQRHFDTNAAVQRETTQIWKMIGDLHRSVQLLDCDIATEEERTRISDKSDAAYSILARMMAARRDNLMDTINALKKRFPSLDPAERIAELA
jgi:hypothetical protein